MKVFFLIARRVGDRTVGGVEGVVGASGERRLVVGGRLGKKKPCRVAGRRGRRRGDGEDGRLGLSGRSWGEDRFRPLRR